MDYVVLKFSRCLCSSKCSPELKSYATKAPQFVSDRCRQVMSTEPAGCLKIRRERLFFFFFGLLTQD